VTLNKFRSTLNYGGEAKSDSGSQVRLMPMRNAMIQEYYDNKKTMLKGTMYGSKLF
jgi:hypothetical protein